MKTFIPLEAHPDELSVGLLGRIASVNGFPSRADALLALRSAMDLPRKATAVQVMAAGVGLELTEFVQHHTLMSASRAFSAHVGTARESSIVVARMSRESGLKIPRAATCMACVQGDRHTGNLSYWRRIHHLPNVDWCVKHQAPLRHFDAAAFDRRPIDVMVDRKPTIRGGLAGPAMTNALERYARLIEHWCNWSSPVSSAALRTVVQEGCRRHGLRCSQWGKRRLLSDLAKQVLPADWLRRHWPDVLGKETGAYLGRLDGVSKDAHVAYPGPTGALALAVLFDSTDEAEALLKAAHTQVLTNRQGRPGSLKERLAAAQKAFCDGSSIGSACSAYDVPTEQLEFVLREAANQLAIRTQQNWAALAG